MRRTASRAHKNRSGDIYCHDLSESSCAHRFHARKPTGNGGVIDQSFDRSQFALSGFKEPDDIFFTGDIGMNCTSAPAGGNNLFSDRCSFRLASGEIDRDGKSAPSRPVWLWLRRSRDWRRSRRVCRIAVGLT